MFSERIEMLRKMVLTGEISLETYRRYIESILDEVIEREVPAEKPFSLADFAKMGDDEEIPEEICAAILGAMGDSSEPEVKSKQIGFLWEE